MHYNIDLRFTVPPLLSLLLLLQKYCSEKFYLLPTEDIANHELLFIAALLFLVILTLVFHLTSVKFLLNVSIDIFPICIRFGDFSGPLALSFMASLLLPPPLFCIAYFICICISPWFALLGQLWQWFYDFHHLLQTIPGFVIVAITRPSQETVEAQPSMTFSVDESAYASHGEIESAWSWVRIRVVSSTWSAGTFLLDILNKINISLFDLRQYLWLIVKYSETQMMWNLKESYSVSHL